MQQQHGATTPEARNAIITPRGLLGAVLFGLGLAVLSLLPVGLVLWAAGTGTLVLIIGAAALLPGAAIMGGGGYLMYRSLRPAKLRASPADEHDAADPSAAMPPARPESDSHEQSPTTTTRPQEDR